MSDLLPWDFFMVRAPARSPADTSVTAGAGAPCTTEAFRRVLSASRTCVPLSVAIGQASPSLAGTAHRLMTGQQVSDVDLRRAALAIVKYDLRMRHRPTPFGLFAGVAIGGFGSAMQSRRTGPDRVRVLPDMGWLLGLVQRWQLHPDVFTTLNVQTNTPLVVRGDRVHLETPANLGLEDGQMGNATVAVRLTPAIYDILMGARAPILVSDLTHQIVGAHGGDPADVLALMLGLAERELILTNLRPPLDGSDPLDHVTERLQVATLTNDVLRAETAQLQQLNELRRHVEAEWPNHEGARAVAELTTAARSLQNHPTPLHIDLGLGVELILPETVREDAATAVQLMRRLSPPRLGMRSLRQWHDDFLEKYGVDQLVPIMEVLDPAAGIGAPAGYEWPLSETAEKPSPNPSATATRDRFLAQLVAHAQRHRLREVALDEHDLSMLVLSEPSPESTQQSCELYALIAAESAQHLQDGRYTLVVAPNPGSHQAGATFGRFASLFDETTCKGLAAAATSMPTAVGTAIAVNLAYQPKSSKAANIAHAPTLTGRRLAVGLTDPKNGVDVVNLCLDDIAVGATLDRIYLTHVPTGHELVPVVHTMLSPGTQAPNIARFMFEVGLEGQRLWEPWDWGPAGAAPFLPRVRYGRVVLCPATWKLDDLQAHAQRRADDLDLDTVHQAISSWCAEWDVPDTVIALSSDQRLTLNLSDPWHQLLLWNEMRRDENLVLQECPGGLTTDWFDPDGSGPRPIELVLPMSRSQSTPTVPPARTAAPIVLPTTSRRSPPASDWLYVRVNTPITTQDEVLRVHLPELVTRMRESGARSWFFIRYSLPQYHLRLRWHGDRTCLVKDALPTLSDTLESWRSWHLIGDWVIDTYEPELERYGGPEVQHLVHSVFHQDSEAALYLLQMLASSSCPLNADEAAAISVAALAHAFGPPRNRTWVDPATANGDPAAAWLETTGRPRDVPTEVRRRRAEWQSLIDPSGNWQSLRETTGGVDLLNHLEPRDLLVTELGRRLREASEHEFPRTPEVRLLGSLMHMSFNRLIGGPSERERSVLAAARMATTANRERRRRT